MSETHVYENGEGHHAPSARTLLSVLLSRIVLCYFALYTVDVLVFILQRLLAPRNTPYSHPWLTGYLWDWMVPWIGQHLLHLKAAVVVNNIGADVPFEFILRGTELALALLASLLWTAIERKQRCDSAFDAWLRLFVRIALASVMLYYGFGKLIPMQFGPLTLHRLSRPLGELSPMGMLWAFMAASKGYTILCGAVEVLGGLLLLLPRLSTLGAFLSAGAMANVFVLNVFYDVNQKTRSLSYLLLALFLLAPYTRQLLNVLLWNRASEPVATQPLSRRRWLRLTFLWLPVVCGVLLLVRMIPLSFVATQRNRKPSPPMIPSSASGRRSALPSPIPPGLCSRRNSAMSSSPTLTNIVGSALSSTPNTWRSSSSALWSGTGSSTRRRRALPAAHPRSSSPTPKTPPGSAF
jgi:uncharacterized membrane protein YphA (DoxX/SURF4 family)